MVVSVSKWAFVVVVVDYVIIIIIISSSSIIISIIIIIIFVFVVEKTPLFIRLHSDWFELFPPFGSVTIYFLFGIGQVSFVTIFRFRFRVTGHFVVVVVVVIVIFVVIVVVLFIVVH